MLMDLGQNLLLDKKRKKAKARIEELLSPIWNDQEIPKILALDFFGQAAESLWKSTGSAFLRGLLDADDDQPLFDVANEVKSLKAISDFTISKSVAAEWERSLSHLEKLAGGATSGFDLDPIEDPHPQFDAIALLRENLDYSAIQRIDAYLNELAAGLSFDRVEYSLTCAAVDPWRQIELCVRLYATAYISRLLYVHGVLDRLLSAAVASGCWVSPVLFSLAKKSNKVTPQILSRPFPHQASL